MAEPKRVDVELSDFLSDLPPVAMKGLVSAPIAYRAERLIEGIPRRYGVITYGDLISALIHRTELDPTELAALIEDYREDRVFATRKGLNESTPERGIWTIELRGPGAGSSGFYRERPLASAIRRANRSRVVG